VSEAGKGGSLIVKERFKPLSLSLSLSLELEKAGLTKDDAELFQRHLPSGLLRQQRTQIQTQTQTQTQAQA